MQGASAGDAVLVGRAAHTLKANAAMFGAAGSSGSAATSRPPRAPATSSGAAQQIEAIDAEWLVVRPQLVALRDGGAAP